MNHKSQNEDDETQTEEETEEEKEDQEVDWHKIIESNINKHKNSMETHSQNDGTERNEEEGSYLPLLSMSRAMISSSAGCSVGNSRVGCTT